MIRPGPCLAAALLLTGSLGSIHAFSVFLVPFETSYAASRGAVSLIYSLALVALTLSVLAGHQAYRMLPPAALAFGACLVAALGLVVAATAPNLWALGFGYSLLFGAANGIGYGFALAVVGQACPRHRGIAMGSVTAVYAVGALVFAKLFEILVAGSGASVALATMAAVLAAVGLASAALLGYSGVVLPRSGPKDADLDLSSRRPLLWRFWLAYGFGVAAGLMAIGHAAGIVSAAGGASDDLAKGVMVIALGNALGGFLAGRLADRLALRHLLSALPLISAASLLGLALVDGVTAVIIGLALVGFAYGAIIAVFPVATAQYFSMALYARAYGRIFTAWGLAGLGAPWLAGLIHDLTASYGWSLMLAAVAGLVSALVAVRLPDLEATQ